MISSHSDFQTILGRGVQNLKSPKLEKFIIIVVVVLRPNTMLALTRWVSTQAGLRRFAKNLFTFTKREEDVAPQGN